MRGHLVRFGLLVALVLGAARGQTVIDSAYAIQRDEVARSIEAGLEQYKVPGLSVAVIEDGRIVWAEGFGVAEEPSDGAGEGRPVRVDTLFQAASISKPVAAMAALRLVAAGRLALDQPVNERLKSWQVPDNEHTAEHAVRVRHLLSHSGGLTVHGFAGYPRDAERPTLLDLLDGRQPANSPAVRVDLPPGQQCRYSGGGYEVLQQLLVDVSGEDFATLMQTEVLKPAGMTQSTYQQPLPEDRAPQAAHGYRPGGQVVRGAWHVYPEQAAAGLWTTPSDLCRFAIALQHAYEGKQDAILPQSLAQTMLTRESGRFGLGLVLEGQGGSLQFSHGGANEGFRCHLMAYAATGQGAVVMTNSDNGGPLAMGLLQKIAREFNWPKVEPSE